MLLLCIRVHEILSEQGGGGRIEVAGGKEAESGDPLRDVAPPSLIEINYSSESRYQRQAFQ